MIKYGKFAHFRSNDWPSLDFMRPYFLAPPGKEWFIYGSGDQAALELQGIANTQHLPFADGRIDIALTMTGFPGRGMFLEYRRIGNSRCRINPGNVETLYMYPRGDMSRLNRFARDLYADAKSEAFIIPFARAWSAVEEFVVTEGQLPKGIEWVPDIELPPEAFPHQHEVDHNGKLIPEGRFAGSDIDFQLKQASEEDHRQLSLFNRG